jgi:anti-sigma regulatory factor (Ser/Thr protein kinase)
MRLTIRNDVAEILSLHDAVVDFCGKHHLNEDILFALDLCIEELITNIVKYGYEVRGDQTIQVDLDLLNGQLVLEIRDDGRPFDPTQIPEPDLNVPLEDRMIGGLGIHLVRNYVNSMEYRREANQNITTLKKNI